MNELKCRTPECQEIHQYTTEKRFLYAQSNGGYLCPACVGKLRDNKSYLEKHKEFLQQKGFEGKMKELGITKEQYYQILKEKEEKHQQLKEERAKIRSEETFRLAQERKELKRQAKQAYLDAKYKELLASMDLANEQWKDIPEHPRYQASNMGRIRNRQTLHLTAGRSNENTHGYVHITLTNWICEGNTVVKRICCKLVHRLIAQTWLPNPDNHPVVNHINHIRHDNRVANLEWCSRSHNASVASDFYKAQRTTPITGT